MTSEAVVELPDDSIQRHATTLLERAQDMADLLRSEAEQDARDKVADAERLRVEAEQTQSEIIYERAQAVELRMQAQRALDKAAEESERLIDQGMAAAQLALARAEEQANLAQSEALRQADELRLQAQARAQ